MAINGSCRCGAVQYSLAMYALPATYICHCLHCQTWSGSAFGQHALFPESAISTSGPVAAYEHQSDGGHQSIQRVCSVCHTRIFNTNAAMPGFAVLRAGTLADSHLLGAPIAHIWTRRKQAWVTIADGVPSWPETPTPQEFAAAVAESQRG
jgi:hypothetical protein